MASGFFTLAKKYSNCLLDQAKR